MVPIIKMFKECKNFNRKKNRNLILYYNNDLNRHFLKEAISMTNKYIKMFNTINHQGNLNVKLKMMCRVISVRMAIMTNSGEIRRELLLGIGGM